jgi:hypothetical protein
VTANVALPPAAASSLLEVVASVHRSADATNETRAKPEATVNLVAYISELAASSVEVGSPPVPLAAGDITVMIYRTLGSALGTSPFDIADSSGTQQVQFPSASTLRCGMPTRLFCARNYKLV